MSNQTLQCEWAKYIDDLLLSQKNHATHRQNTKNFGKQKPKVKLEFNHTPKGDSWQNYWKNNK